MGNAEAPRGVEQFLGMPYPAPSEQFLDQFNREIITFPPVMQFQPQDVARQLAAVDRSFVTLDTGGNNATIRQVRLNQGRFQTVGRDYKITSSEGVGYIDVLRRANVRAAKRGLPLIASFAGPVIDGQPADAPNMHAYLEDIRRLYGGDIRAAASQLAAVFNDAPAAMMAGALQAPDAKNHILVIVGSGLGLAVLVDGQIIPTEGGHLEADQTLNPKRYDRPCNLVQRTHQGTCVENLAAGVAGIEAAWLAETGEALKGPDISRKMRKGNALAMDLYNNSAVAVAHLITGAMNKWAMSPERGQTAVILHGGMTKVPGYAEKISNITSHYVGDTLPFVVTTNFSSNACLEGAAVGGFLATQAR